MKLKIMDLAVIALTVGGLVSDFNKIDVPFWAYLIVSAIYFSMRSGLKVEKEV